MKIKNNKKKIFLLAIMILMLGCGKADSSEMESPCRKFNFEYTIESLGSIGGGKYYYAVRGINSDGQVIGTFRDTESYKFNNHGGITSVNSKYPDHAFVWNKDSGIVKFDQYGQKSVPLDINDNGFVVGRIAHNGKEVPFVWEKEMGIIYLESIPEGQGIGHDMYRGSAYAINNLNQVVGCIETNEEIHEHFKDLKIDYRSRGRMKYIFIWDKENGLRIINPEELSNACALDINDQGNIAGYFDEISGDTRYRHSFFLDKKNGIQNIGIINEKTFSAELNNIFINNNNEVVIPMLREKYPDNLKMCRWNQTEGLKLIDTEIWSSPLKLNEKNQILSICESGMCVFDFKSNMSYIARDTILPKEYGTSLQRAITNEGYFVGLKNNATEKCSIFLLKPECEKN